MFDLGWSEILVIVVVALIVIGPKDLPQAVRTVTQIIRKMRGMAREFQSSLDDLAREAGVDEIKRDLDDFKADYDPRAALESIADSDRELAETFDEAGPAAANSIEAPRPAPPDLTPADFGAADEKSAEISASVSGVAPADEAAPGPAAGTADTGSAGSRRDGGTA